MLEAEHLAGERGPFGAPRPPNQHHVRLLGGAPAFAPIAGMAGADDVFPSRHAALRARVDVIEVQLGPREALAAVLAGIVVAREDIKTRETHMTLRYPLVGYQDQHPRYADEPAHDAEALMMHLNREIPPTVEIEGAVLLVDRLGDTLVEQRKGALYRGHMDRQVGPVQDEDPAIEQSPALPVKRD